MSKRCIITFLWRVYIGLSWLKHEAPYANTVCLSICHVTSLNIFSITEAYCSWLQFLWQCRRNLWKECCSEVILQLITNLAWGLHARLRYINFSTIKITSAIKSLKNYARHMCVYTCNSCYIYLSVAEYPFDYFLEYLLISRPVPSVFTPDSRTMYLPLICVKAQLWWNSADYWGTSENKSPTTRQAPPAVTPCTFI